MSVELVSVSPNAEEAIVKMARVSSRNPDNTDTKLLKYLINHKHWSPFEMMNLVVKIKTTRDISRQILRHRSFSFQEFSQRYQDVRVMERPPNREARLQDHKNRQNSIAVDDEKLQEVWNDIQDSTWALCVEQYSKALEMGIAKEQARCLLPEGMAPTIMYMSGNIRSWMHYIDLRTGNGTQKEHMIVANEIKAIFKEHFPTCSAAMGF